MRDAIFTIKKKGFANYETSLSLVYIYIARIRSNYETFQEAHAMLHEDIISIQNRAFRARVSKAIIKLTENDINIQELNRANNIDRIREQQANSIIMLTIAHNYLKSIHGARLIDSPGEAAVHYLLVRLSSITAQMTALKVRMSKYSAYLFEAWRDFDRQLTLNKIYNLVRGEKIGIDEKVLLDSIRVVAEIRATDRISINETFIRRVKRKQNTCRELRQMIGHLMHEVQKAEVVANSTKVEYSVDTTSTSRPYRCKIGVLHIDIEGSEENLQKLKAARYIQERARGYICRSHGMDDKQSSSLQISKLCWGSRLRKAALQLGGVIHQDSSNVSTILAEGSAKFSEMKQNILEIFLCCTQREIKQKTKHRDKINYHYSHMLIIENSQTRSSSLIKSDFRLLLPGSYAKYREKNNNIKITKGCFEIVDLGHSKMKLALDRNNEGSDCGGADIRLLNGQNEAQASWRAYSEGIFSFDACIGAGIAEDLHSRDSFRSNDVGVAHAVVAKGTLRRKQKKIAKALAREKERQRSTEAWARTGILTSNDKQVRRDNYAGAPDSVAAIEKSGPQASVVNTSRGHESLRPKAATNISLASVSMIRTIQSAGIYGQIAKGKPTASRIPESGVTTDKGSQRGKETRKNEKRQSNIKFLKN